MELSNDKWFWGFVIGLFVFGIYTGWVGNDFYRDISDKRTINGIWLQGNDNMTWDDAMETAQSRDTIGSFICVNIKGMTIKEMQETILHETMHEAFAQYCNLKNEDKCMGALSKLKGENNSG